MKPMPFCLIRGRGKIMIFLIAPIAIIMIILAVLLVPAAIPEEAAAHILADTGMGKVTAAGKIMASGLIQPILAAAIGIMILKARAAVMAIAVLDPAGLLSRNGRKCSANGQNSPALKTQAGVILSAGALLRAQDTILLKGIISTLFHTEGRGAGLRLAVLEAFLPRAFLHLQFILSFFSLSFLAAGFSFLSFFI